MIIPHTQLSESALLGAIESFVNREGTDYGEQAVSHEDKVNQVRAALKSGHAVMLYDEASESINILPRESVPPEWLSL
ncbi:YheU family protein [Marinibactrum halimedae]|uniref:UPF0270 protein n=1 Tax=Marinibactrum halimedae TaxID=1444977 RepID=A0AA37TAA7_9GAMM|nr:YheU family protein [Marinibactrum halimedae]MCD9457844.1 YheU family protein [Marinibactrum halimedae]GLS26335.1 UPF0270 protein [Marinibactrum halimedae]